MIYHLLPGDAQVETFKQTGIDGEFLVCRECLIEGDVSGATLDDFLMNRATFFNGAYGEDPTNYNANVASQLRKLTEMSGLDEVNLWFEYELFCSVNMWFCLDLVSKSDAAIYRVAPGYLTVGHRWDGFGRATADDMRRCYEARIKLSVDDIALGSKLWHAFQNSDKDGLRQLGKQESPAFPYLDELCEAAIDCETGPAAILKEIRNEGITDFGLLFAEFRRRAGVYGYGDGQVKRILETI
jgi:hypothetical protein